MSTPSRELLIVSPERWDEACFSVPAVRALAGSGLGIGVLCQPHQKDFWQTLPGLEVSTPDSLEAQWQVALLWEDGELAKFVRKAGIHKRIGPEVGKLPKQLTETLKDKPHPTDHRVQFYLKAAAEMGAETAKPEYFSPAQPELPPQKNSILLVPDSDFGPSHEWSLQNWKTLADRLMGDHQLAIARIKSERSLCDELAELLDNETPGLAINLREPQLDVISSHATVIAADGSLPHLAAHLGATCITLYGPNNPQWKRPLGKRHRVVCRHVECSPCYHADCPLDLRCQKELGADQVLDALKEVMA